MRPSLLSVLVTLTAAASLTAATGAPAADAPSIPSLLVRGTLLDVQGEVTLVAPEAP